MQTNQNIVSGTLTLTASGSAASPQILSLPGYGDMLIGIIAYTDTGLSNFRILHKGNRIIPTNGAYIALPATHVLELKFEKPMIGPPYELTIQAFTPGGSNSEFYINLLFGDRREKDLELRQMQILEHIRKLLESRVYGIPLNIGPDITVNIDEDNNS